ncbi:MAG TPA: MJ1255/VC2487 family glycosyltransferase, partial [Methanobacterium sp.]
GKRGIALKYAKSTFYQFTGRKISADKLNYQFGHTEGKKRILYGVCGEGMGHAIRSGVVIDHLLEKNDVTIFASDRAYHYLSGKYDDVYEIEGFKTVYEANEVKNRRTFVKNIKDIPQDLGHNLRLMYNVAKATKPDLIISDFEFYSNLLSKLLRIPLVSLDNMHVITQCEVDVPEEFRRDRFRAASVVRSFIQRPRHYLITSYFFPPVKNPVKVKMFPPILREKVLKLKPTIGEHILVYQTSDSNIKLLKLLKEIDDEFVIYGFHKDEKIGNLNLKSFNEDEFFDDLASARAIITNGGFSLISEALYLKKPVFSIPVKKQFEQILNAIYLDKLEYGEFHQDLDKEGIEKFLSNLDFYREKIETRFKHDHNQAIFRQLDEIIEELTKI